MPDQHPLSRGFLRPRRQVGEIGARIGRLELLGQPEVDHLDGELAAGARVRLARSARRTGGGRSSRSTQDDVGGLEVAMDDAALVRRLESAGDLHRDAQRVADRYRAAVSQSASVGPAMSSSTERRTPSPSSMP